MQGRDVVVSLGRTLPGQTLEIQIGGNASTSAKLESTLVFARLLRSGTALPVMPEDQTTNVRREEADDDDSGR